jgi:hypothetical protein
MKKIFTIMCAFLLAISVSAQSWTDRWTDDSYLPEDGNWSIGFDATSSLNYFGNLFNSSATAPTAGYVEGFEQTIYGKLMTSNVEAWRVRAGLNMHKAVDNEDVQDNSSSDPDAMVTNKNSIGNTNINLWFGKEYRKGNTRLQGVYGAEAGLGISSATEKNDYGNSAEYGGTGMIEDKSGMNLGVMLRGFIGFEYFMMPRISIGGEYGWGFSYKSMGGGSTTNLSWDGATSNENTTDNANDSEIGFMNDNATGSLVLRMYF